MYTQFAIAANELVLEKYQIQSVNFPFPFQVNDNTKYFCIFFYENFTKMRKPRLFSLKKWLLIVATSLGTFCTGIIIAILVTIIVQMKTVFFPGMNAENPRDYGRDVSSIITKPNLNLLFFMRFI